MAENIFNTWHPMIFEPKNYPKNLPKVQRLTIQTDVQKDRLEKEITSSRYEHLKYLNEHLEIRAVIREFMQEISKEFPNDTEIPAFCNKLFGQCKVQFQSKIMKHVRDLEEQRRNKLFPYTRKPITSTSSEINDTSNSTSTGLFASSTGSTDIICDCHKNHSAEAEQSSDLSSTCVCDIFKRSASDDCSLKYKSEVGEEDDVLCACFMESSSSCKSDCTMENSIEPLRIESDMQQMN